jgi:tetratricopeptide (TPR) repeat protein
MRELFAELVPEGSDPLLTQDPQPTISPSPGAFESKTTPFSNLTDLQHRPLNTISDAVRWRASTVTASADQRVPSHPWEKLARQIEINQAILELVRDLLPGRDCTIEMAGRLHFLAEILDTRPELTSALVRRDAEAMRRMWRDALAAQRGNPRFLHGLAVLYREEALRKLNTDSADSDLWPFSTALWAALLCADEFWDYFSADRTTSGVDGSPAPLDTATQDALAREAMNNILGLHRTFGSRELAGGRSERAGVHANCLHLCRSGADALTNLLARYGVAVELRMESGRLDRLMELANELLDDWCSVLVREAERITTDPAAIQQLPQGIRQNYRGGLDHLDRFIGLGIPVIRVLRTSLHWYNEWCYDLYVSHKLDQIVALMGPARAVADLLGALCVKARGHAPENQALSTHYLLRGFTTDNQDQGMEYYREALAWNPANQNAEQLLGEAAQAVIMDQIEVAIKCIDSKQFSRAYEVLDSVEARATDKQPIHHARAVVAFRHAHSEAEDGHYRAALERARQALELAPDEPAVSRLAAELEELAPEEDALRELHAARDAYDRDRYDEVIRRCTNVPSDSSFASHARRLRSAAHFNRAINAANESRLDAAIRDLEEALAASDNPEEQKIISRQLDMIRQASTGSAIQDALNRKDWGTAEALLRGLLPTVRDKQRRQVEQQLAMVLNAHAVDLANEAQESQSRLFESLDAKISTGMDIDQLRRLFESTKSNSDERLQRARTLLDEALRLDGQNRQIKQNAESIRQLLSR